MLTFNYVVLLIITCYKRYAFQVFTHFKCLRISSVTHFKCLRISCVYAFYSFDSSLLKLYLWIWLYYFPWQLRKETVYTGKGIKRSVIHFFCIYDSHSIFLAFHIFAFLFVSMFQISYNITCAYYACMFCF